MLAAQAEVAPVLIFGASGTGKGSVAQWIHANGPRAARAFREVHHRDDVSLADLIPALQGGTLVLHEIGEWPLAEQKVLFDFLATHSVPVNEQDGMRRLVNTRIIATTSQALEGRAQAGLFSPDLLEKLNVFRIEMPPLAKRADEFDDIVLGIVGEITRELHKEYLRELSPDAWARLRSYNWPGNIRELRNVLRLAVVAAKEDAIMVADLPSFGADRVDFHATREQFERIYIVELLKTFDGDIDKTCRLTRLDKSVLLAKLEKYGITPNLEL